MFTIIPTAGLETGLHVFSTLVARAKIPHIQYYEYDPSRALAIVGTVLYAATAATHIFQMVRSRSWYFSILVLAALMETFGYFSRILSDHDVYSRPLYIAQFTLVVLAPVFIAAGDYVLFGKLLESVLPGGRRARALGVSARFVTYIFISGDILSFVLQGIGAGIMTGATDGIDIKKMNLGRDIMLSGLAIQILTFSFFICATIRFSFKAQDLAVPGAERPKWRVLLWALYFSSFLIMVIFNIFHPAKYLLQERKDSPASSIEEGQEK
ncbi:hypothetical protein Q9L58_000990 [Maublancomyces gigas]|uniref:RTA1 like protein n=1 Tax=Discina gigas TaxID=1032678 RepID=A0ABR3GVF5_9PEZI